jgi:hypothetical protein
VRACASVLGVQTAATVLWFVIGLHFAKRAIVLNVETAPPDLQQVLTPNYPALHQPNTSAAAAAAVM